MTNPVKRPTDRANRGNQARTRLARRAVVDAARTLFLDRGYAATTIDAISDEADVPPATIYRLFSSKLGILKSLLDVSIAGDDQPLSVQDRPEATALLAEPDPFKMLAGFVRMNVGINERTVPIYRILLTAASAEPEAAELLDRYTQLRRQGQGRIARALARGRALRSGVNERAAADIIHALMSPEMYRLLVSDRGWSNSRYRAWLATVLVQQLLAPKGG